MVLPDIGAVYSSPASFGAELSPSITIMMMTRFISSSWRMDFSIVSSRGDKSWLYHLHCLLFNISPTITFLSISSSTRNSVTFFGAITSSHKWYKSSRRHTEENFSFHTFLPTSALPTIKASALIVTFNYSPIIPPHSDISLAIMYTILCAGVTFLVTSLLALYSPGILRRTIGEGMDADFLSLVKLSWNNPFSKKSILEYADAFVALQADRILPAVLPGATSIGRPYIFEKEKACFLNLTMANNTGNPFMDVANPSNLTGLMDSGNLDGIPPMERVIISGVWYGYLVVFYLLLLALAFVAVSNCSFRTAAARIDACVSSLVAVTGGDDPEKSKLLREFARQQGLLIDPYNLDLSKSCPAPSLMLVQSA